MRKQRKKQRALLQDAQEEYKIASASWDDVSVPLAHIITDCTGISAGTSYTTRIGNRINVKEYEYSLVFDLGDSTNVVRFLVFQWLGNSTDGVPSWTDILDYGTSGEPTSLRDIVSLPVRSRNQDLYEILEDRIILLNGYDKQEMRCLGRGKPFVGHVFYDASSNEGKNHIYCMMASDSGAVPNPTVAGQFRVIYEDS
jgi:hypothetical protein